MATRYCTYEQYTENGGSLQREEFEPLAVWAASEIHKHTLGRADTAPEVMRPALVRCMCDLVALLHSYVTAEELLAKGIQSVNNDGLSITGVANRATLQAAEIRDTCRQYLVMPVNLMKRSVRL